MSAFAIVGVLTKSYNNSKLVLGIIMNSQELRSYIRLAQMNAVIAPSF